MKTIIKNATLINEGQIRNVDVLIKNKRIEKIAAVIDEPNAIEIDATNKLLIPGIIDDQVHFREPGFTHKANIYTESRAAVAGGTTSFMEMPNTNPAATTQQLLEEKYAIAARDSVANYSFFMGASNNNYEQVMQTDIQNVCGIKIFMGSSTGNMLVDDESTLSKLFANAPCLIATHCEDEGRIKARKYEYEKANVTAEIHPIIRDVEACYLSSSKAIKLAQKFNTRLHILHISTAKETSLFTNEIPLKDKRITAEVCVHHLTLNDTMYSKLGNKMKCNPAIKSITDQNGLWNALLDDRLDIIATDHAPHTAEEKANQYAEAPSGLPLVQHSLLLMLQHYKNGNITLERMVEKMCHAPAICFEVTDRGFIREGYFADLVLIDQNVNFEIDQKNILYKCNWSPFEGTTFSYSVNRTFVNGNIVFENNNGINDSILGNRLIFNR